MIKRGIKSLFRHFGIDIRRHNAISTPTDQIVSTLKRHNIDLVLDVGANSGQFAAEIRGRGYIGKIVSFEPLSKAHALLQKSKRGDKEWVIHQRCAIGDHNGEAEINIAGNSTSSSLLPMLNSHVSAEPSSAYVGTEVVALKSLDSVAPDYMADCKRTFLKIDTQGFEWQVLDGANNILPNIHGVLLELSLVPLYEGQHLWLDLIGRLEREGFVLWALQPGFTDPISAKTLQVDGIFFRA